MKKNEFKEMLAKEFIAVLESGKLPWVKEWSTGRDKFGAYNYHSKRRYTGANRFWLELKTQDRGYATNAFITFNQCKERGWKLKDAKGEGLPVSFWYPYDTQAKKAITWEEYNKLLKDQVENAEQIANIAIYMRAYYVFNARHVIIDENERTLEEDLLSKLPKREHIQEDIALADAMLDEYCVAEGIDIVYGGDIACYNPITDTINLPKREDFSADSFYFSTKAHESAHSTGADTRLKRGLKNGFGSSEYAKEELIAEITAAFLCADCNIPQTEKVAENSKAYVQSWIEGLKNKPDALLKALDEGERVVAFIKEKGNYEAKFGKEEKVS